MIPLAAAVVVLAPTALVPWGQLVAMVVVVGPWTLTAISGLSTIRRDLETPVGMLPFMLAVAWVTEALAAEPVVPVVMLTMVGCKMV